MAQDILKDFLESNRNQVVSTSLEEFDQELYEKIIRDEGREEGRLEGHTEGVFETLISLVQKGLISLKDAAAQAGITESAFRQKMAGK